MKIGRNEICPCGSNLKYKSCCLATESPSTKRDEEHLPPLDEVAVLHGFTKEHAEKGPFEIDFEEACCLVIKADAEIAAQQNQIIQFDMVNPGDWFVIAHVNGQIKTSYRYDTADEAMDIAKEKFEAVRFLSLPEFI
ncbi:MAG: hypothetical protein ACJAS1_005256 [Oleiphilaceae bacterium]|jgi:hypothetical protein